MAVRVHELATDLEIDANELIAELESLDISVRNHMSRIKDKETERIYEHFVKRSNARAVEWAKTRQAEVEVGPKAPASKAKPKSEAKSEAESTPEAMEDQHRKIEEAQARAAAARAQADAHRKTAAATLERHKLLELQKTAKSKPPADRPERPEGRAPLPSRETAGERPASRRPGPRGSDAPPRDARDARGRRAPGAGAPANASAPVGRQREGAKPPRQKGEGEFKVDLENVTIGVMKMDKEGGKRGRRRDKKKPGVRATEQNDAGASTAAQRQKHRMRPTRLVPGASGRRAPSAKPRSLASKKSAPRPMAPPQPVIKQVRVHGQITTAELAEKMRIDASELIKKALLMGSPVTLNEAIDPDMVQLFCMELGYGVEFIPDTDESDVEQLQEGRRDDSRRQSRPPVVTIMGHVDHGKTSLLEQIAKLEVLESEHGGITQHIGAYHVHTDRGEVVFLDTPGHAAFTSMRLRGAQATDVVALVVAANDGVMPQTIEAINHAKAAEVPIVVVINKIDLPEADPMRVRQQLMSYDLVPEEYGGSTLFCEISAKQSIGIDGFLETLLLQAEMLELECDPDGPADGVIIEALLNQQRGIEATVLVQQGRLKVGDVLLAGQTFGRIRSMLDNRGHAIKEVCSPFPARVYGLTGEAPEAGEPFLALEDDRLARQISERRANRRRKAGLDKRSHVSLEGLKDYLASQDVKKLNLIIKGDVQGSIEAIEQSLEKIPSEKVKLQVLHSAVGSITENDVRLADASDAIIIGFNVRAEAAAESLAYEEGIDVKCYTVIYALLDDIQKAMLGLLDQKFKEIPQGKAEVLKPFKIGKLGTIAGSMVLEGEIRSNSNIRLLRDGKVIYQGKINSLRRHKDASDKVLSGLECGIGLERFGDIKKGDIIEAYALEEMERTLE